MKLRGSKPLLHPRTWPRVGCPKTGWRTRNCFSASGASSWRSGDENFRLQARSDSCGSAYKIRGEDMAFRIMRHRTGQQKHMPPLEGKGAILDSYFARHDGLNAEKRETFSGFLWIHAMDRYMDPQLALQKKYESRMAPLPSNGGMCFCWPVRCRMILKAISSASDL